MEEVLLGQYAVPVLLTAVLGFMFKMLNFEESNANRSNRIKLGMAVSVGIALGILALGYKSQIPDSKIVFSFVPIVDHILYGFMMGASAIGIYELQKGVKGK